MLQQIFKILFSILLANVFFFNALKELL